MKVIVQLRDQTGALVGIDIWGAVLDVNYSSVENAVTVRGSDDVGVRHKWYGSGSYASVLIVAAGGEDSTAFPVDAQREGK